MIGLLNKRLSYDSLLLYLFGEKKDFCFFSTKDSLIAI